MDCIFCKIINKEIPSKVVFEDDKIIAFEDINKVAPVHVLIVPKIHLPNIKEFNQENIHYIADIHLVAIKIAKQMQIEDFRLINNCGKSAGQSVFHIHYHLIGGGEFLKLI